VEIRAASNGTFSMTDGGSREGVRGTYSGTNPANCTIAQINLGVYENRADDWKAWSDLTQQQKGYVGGSQTFMVIIYDNKCEGMGYIFQKRP
jgi:hypothetical protein